VLVGVFWILSILAHSGGNSALRDSFASAYVYRMKRNQARLLLPTDEARKVETPSVGQAVLWRASGETQTIAIPNTTVQDVVQVAQGLQGGLRTPEAMLASAAADLPASEWVVDQVLGSEDGSGNGSRGGSGTMHDLKAMQGLGLFLAGKGQREILAEVWGVTGGPPYQQAARLFNEVIRNELRRNLSR
jgi:hypothetical protein